MEEGLANQQATEDRFNRELERAAAIKVSDLAVSGDDVMRELHLPPGPQVGKILTRLLDRVLDDPNLNSRENLIRLLPDMLQELSTDNSQGTLPSEDISDSVGQGTPRK